MSINGLSFVGTKIKSPMAAKKTAANFKEGEKRNDKYLSVSKPGKYRVRLVSGYQAYSSLFDKKSGKYKISPRTLLLEVETEYVENGVTKSKLQRIHNHPSGRPYDAIEAFCPLTAATGEEPQTKYAINVIDRNAQAANPDGPVPIKILSGAWSLFEKFFTFQGEINPHAPEDPDKGNDFIITTTEKINDKGKSTTTYSVDYFKESSPLTEKERIAVSKYKFTDPNDKGNGLWDLATEYHPFKCAKGMRVDGIEYDESPAYQNKQSSNEETAPAAPPAAAAAATVSIETFANETPQGTVPVSTMSEQIQPTAGPVCSTTIEDIMRELGASA